WGRSVPCARSHSAASSQEFAALSAPNGANTSSCSQELVLVVPRRQGDVDAEGGEPVRCLVVHPQLGASAGAPPARLHEEGVVEQRVHGAHLEEGGRHGGESGVEGGDVGVAARLRVAVAEELVGEPPDHRGGEDEVAVAPAALARGEAEVEGAVDEV